MSLIQEYAQSLAALTGQDFEDEVCARLQGVILDFQTVPATPQGDGGLDGFSHGGARGYCCYGLKPDEFKSNKQRENAIVEKFKSDLRRLCELDHAKRKLICIENEELCTILPNGQKLQHVTLLVNWFDSHRVLNPILTAFAEYRQTSLGRYVASDASVVVLGPKELANQYAVDEGTITRSKMNQAGGCPRLTMNSKLCSVVPKNSKPWITQSDRRASSLKWPSTLSHGRVRRGWQKMCAVMGRGSASKHKSVSVISILRWR
jgi:hypothetical protein